VLITMELDRTEEITAKKTPKIPIACPIVDQAKTHSRDIESELGKKLSNQKSSPRIPFAPGPTTAEDVLPRMIHFGGEHRLLDVKLDNNLTVKEQEPSISNVDINPIHKNIPLTKIPLSPSAPKKLITRHPQAAQLKPQQRVLESYVIWKDQIYNLNQFYAGDNIIIGSGPEATVVVPTMNKLFKLAQFDGMNTQIFIPHHLKFELENETQNYSQDHAPTSPSVSKKNNFYTLKLGASDLLTIQVAPDIFIHLRYAPSPREFSVKMNWMKGEAMKVPALIVGVLAVMVCAYIFSAKSPTVQSLQQDSSPRAVAGVPAGGLSHAQVIQAIKPHVSELQQCYKNSPGNVQYELGINGAGVLQIIKFKQSTIPNAMVYNPCVIGVLKKVTFPSSADNLATVTNLDFSVKGL
jgi:hypothetical protein